MHTIIGAIGIGMGVVFEWISLIMIYIDKVCTTDAHNIYSEIYQPPHVPKIFDLTKFLKASCLLVIFWHKPMTMRLDIDILFNNK